MSDPYGRTDIPVEPTKPNYINFSRPFKWMAWVFLWLCYLITNNTHYDWDNVRVDMDGSGLTLFVWGFCSLLTAAIIFGSWASVGPLALLFALPTSLSFITTFSVRAIFSLHKSEARQHWSEVLL